MEEELISAQNQKQQLQLMEKQSLQKISELEDTVLTKEKQLASTEKLLEVLVN